MRGCRAANARQVISGEDMLPPKRLLAFIDSKTKHYFMGFDSLFGVRESLTGEGLYCTVLPDTGQMGMVSDPDPYWIRIQSGQ